MDLVVRKIDLLRELQLFQGIVERKNTIPILANVLIEAKGDHVKLLATDLEVALRSTCAASVSKGGSLTGRLCYCQATIGAAACRGHSPSTLAQKPPLVPWTRRRAHWVQSVSTVHQ